MDQLYFSIACVSFLVYFVDFQERGMTGARGAVEENDDRSDYRRDRHEADARRRYVKVKYILIFLSDR